METDFPCTKCGSCCKILPDEALKIHNLPRAEDGGCGNLLPDNSCKIYDTRPDVCNAKLMWTKTHSKKLTWEEYVALSEDLCKILQTIDPRNKQKEQVE